MFFDWKYFYNFTDEPLDDQFFIKTSPYHHKSRRNEYIDECISHRDLHTQNTEIDITQLDLTSFDRNPVLENHIRDNIQTTTPTAITCYSNNNCHLLHIFTFYKPHRAKCDFMMYVDDNTKKYVMVFTSQAHPEIQTTTFTYSCSHGSCRPMFPNASYDNAECIINNIPLDTLHNTFIKYYDRFTHDEVN